MARRSLHTVLQQTEGSNVGQETKSKRSERRKVRTRYHPHSLYLVTIRAFMGGSREKIFSHFSFPASFLSLRFGHWVDCGFPSWKGPPCAAISPPASISCPISGRGGGPPSRAYPPSIKLPGRKKGERRGSPLASLSPFEREKAH